jgi:hypothetical protein
MSAAETKANIESKNVLFNLKLLGSVLWPGLPPAGLSA